jgi:hypothetical protein
MGRELTAPALRPHPPCAAAGDTEARAVSTQWLLGEGLLVSPAVQQGVASVDAYIPPGVWYSAWDYRAVAGELPPPPRSAAPARLPA